MSESLTGNELFNYKIKLIRDAQGWKKPDRTPFNSNMFTWMFHEAGYTTAQATRDYDIIEKCMVRYVTKYKVDMINAGNSGFRNAFLVMDSLGSGSSYSDKESQNLNAVIEDVFTPDDYDAVKENFQKAIWERALFRRYPAASAYSPEKFAEAVKTLYDLNEARARIDTRMRDEFGIVCERSWLNFFPGYEYFFKYFRGIKGVAMDLRRCPEKLYEVSDAIDEVNVKNCEDFLFREADGINWNEPYDVMIGMLGHTILNRKQFDRLWIPSTKKVLDCCEKHGKQVWFFSEGSWGRFGDFFNEYKKGTCNMMAEDDDPFEMRAKYPNLCLNGGLSVDMMGHGTPEECVEMAKKAINELGCDGGLILAPNKMVSYAYDMKAENLKAVGDFVFEYKN